MAEENYVEEWATRKPMSLSGFLSELTDLTRESRLLIELRDGVIVILDELADDEPIAVNLRWEPGFLRYVAKDLTEKP